MHRANRFADSSKPVGLGASWCLFKKAYKKKMLALSAVIVWCFFAIAVLTMSTSKSTYETARAAIIETEREQALGGDLILTAAEEALNRKLLRIKREELNSAEKPWTRNFLRTADQVKKSKIFEIIRKLPKGASLHSHLFASASYRYVVDDLINRTDLYVCKIGNRTKLKFLRESDAEKEVECESIAAKRGSPDFDGWLARHLLVRERETAEEIWDGFRKIFTFTYDLVSYRSIVEDYVRRVLLEHYADNVFYLEVRSAFVQMYDLDGKYYGAEDFVELLWRVGEAFKKDRPDFVGLKMIYAQYRGTNIETVRENFALLKVMMRKYPGFIVGVDLLGFEEERTLLDLVEDLTALAATQNVHFYFHAGETNRQGAPVDLNLADAILLGSKRIGHAYALPKHPRLMRLVGERRIAVEVCPLSNQVLGLVADLRNHPASYLIARGFPVVVCNDDPGYWGAEGLSYDWYAVFMAMSGEEQGLELLKKLALNSLEYAALNEAERWLAMETWHRKWHKFVEHLNREIE